MARQEILFSLCVSRIVRGEPMSKKGLIAFIIAVIVLLSLIPRSIRPALGQAASTEAPHFGEGGLPQFERDPNFPKVPSKWRMGFGSDVAVDAQNHIWILSRPHTLAHPRSTPPDLVSVPAPPVIEFDTDGNFIQAWGGESGPGYQWPSNEHGIHIDYKGFVWILGNADGKSNNPANLPNDNQILKFTKEGKFVMAIGKSGQTEASQRKSSKEPPGFMFTPKRTNYSSATDTATAASWCMTQTRDSSSACGVRMAISHSIATCVRHAPSLRETLGLRSLKFCSSLDRLCMM